MHVVHQATAPLHQAGCVPWAGQSAEHSHTGDEHKPVRGQSKDHTPAWCRADARARQRGEYSHKVHATRDLEQELSMEFPHGLPVS